jgi:hypothetical protein
MTVVSDEDKYDDERHNEKDRRKVELDVAFL